MQKILRLFSTNPLQSNRFYSNKPLQSNSKYQSIIPLHSSSICGEYNYNSTRSSHYSSNLITGKYHSSKYHGSKREFTSKYHGSNYAFTSNYHGSNWAFTSHLVFGGKIVESSHRSISCFTCKNELTKSGDCNTCQVNLFPSTKNYFSLLNQPMKFNLNDKDLKKNYRMLVAQWHPDRFTKSVNEQVKAQETSIQVNKAFQTLKDPLKRSHYLLKLYDYEITEHTRLNDPDFLLQVMEIQEEIVQGQGLREMQKENDERIQKSIEILSDLFDVKQDYKMAQKEAIKLNYYYTITKLIQDF